MGRHTLYEEPVPHHPARPDRTAERSTGQSTGTHRVVGAAEPRRRIAKWPIACLVITALIALGVVGWNWADNMLNSRAEAQAVSCPAGNSTLRILVTPSADKPVTQAATTWNDATTVVHEHCVHVDVQAMQSDRVLNALSGRSDLAEIGGLPAAWIPEATYWVGDLQTTKPEIIGSPPQSIASAVSADYPFLGLAGTGVDDTQMRAAQTFREFLKQPAQQKAFADAGITAT